MAKIISLDYKTHNAALKRVNFSRESLDTGLVSTIITGENGVGKSSILEKIVKGILQPKQSNNINENLKIFSGSNSFDDELNNFNIIAASGSTADRFPLKRFSLKDDSLDNPRYIYLGQKVNSNLWSKKQSLEVISTFLFDDENKYKLSSSLFNDVCSTVGLQPDFEFEYQLQKIGNSSYSFNKRDFEDIWSAVGSIKDGNEKLSASLKISKTKADYLLKNFSNETFHILSDFVKGPNKKIFKLNVSDSINSEEPPDLIRLAILTGVIRLFDIKVLSKLTNKRFSIFDLSSGEYHFLCNILGVYVASNSNSIILIDEPENSLHPKWQLEFMQLLFEACNHVKNGHLIVSTHSPLIVSSAQINTEVIDLSNLNTETKNYFGSSVDNLLIEHFGLVSPRNLYFVDLLQTTVDLFSKGIRDTEEYLSNLKKLELIKSKLSVNDPLFEVIEVLGGKND